LVDEKYSNSISFIHVRTDSLRTCYGKLWHDDDDTTYTSGNIAVKIDLIATTDWEMKFRGNTGVTTSIFKVGVSPETYLSLESTDLTQTIPIYDGYEQLSLTSTTITADGDLSTDPAGFVIYIDDIAADENSWKCTT
jgi:hypothetical protein